MKKINFIFIILFFNTCMLSQDKNERKLETKADFRFAYIADYNKKNSEFVVKNARFFIESKNYDNVSFRIMADFSPLLSFSTRKDTINGRQFLKEAQLSYNNVLLDAWIGANFYKHNFIIIGQFKVPFSIENFLRSPMQITFSNRTILLNRVYPELRDAGLYFMSKNIFYLPINFYLGAYNGEGLNKKQNDKTINTSTRFEYVFLKKNMISADFYFGNLNKEEVYIFNLGSEINFGNLNIVLEGGNRHSITNIKEYNKYGAYLDIKYAFELEKNKLYSIRRIVPAIRLEYLEPDDLTIDDEFGKSTLGLKVFHNDEKNFETSFFYEYFVYKSSHSKNYFALIFETRYWFY